MNYFKRYVSNTYAGVANQFFTEIEEGRRYLARVFYKITVPGNYNYSLLFSSMTDGSFRRLSKPNTVIDEWTLHSVRVAACHSFPNGEELSLVDMEKDVCLSDFSPLTFSGKGEYKPTGGEFFATDPIRLDFSEGEYLCLELEYSGRVIPTHPEIQIPTYRLDDGVWKYSVDVPVACMIGCDRKVKARVGYLGDSITQGCGAGLNSYKHWCAVTSSLLGDEYGYHNLGIGYGKASDAASDGAWLYRAKQNDVVFVCYGVNDVNTDKDADTIFSDISSIVDKLTEAGCRIILQTTPPFDYPEQRRIVWERLNERIKGELKNRVEYLFDCTKVLGVPDTPHRTLYGGHPDAHGCEIWGKALYESVKHLFQTDDT